MRGSAMQPGQLCYTCTGKCTKYPMQPSVMIAAAAAAKLTGSAGSLAIAASAVANTLAGRLVGYGASRLPVVGPLWLVRTIANQIALASTEQRCNKARQGSSHEAAALCSSSGSDGGISDAQPA